MKGNCPSCKAEVVITPDNSETSIVPTTQNPPSPSSNLTVSNAEIVKPAESSNVINLYIKPFIGVTLIVATLIYVSLGFWRVFYGESEGEQKWGQSVVREFIAIGGACLLFTVLGWLWSLGGKGNEAEWPDRWNSERRIWTDKSEKRRWLGILDEHNAHDNLVSILRADQSKMSVCVADLSIKDQEYVGDWDSARDIESENIG
jgi:hypothetical protein